MTVSGMLEGRKAECDETRFLECLRQKGFSARSMRPVSMSNSLPKRY